MKLEQIYTGCLAQATYYLESNGEAAIFDPLREVQQYIDKASDNNATIKYIFETHFHADFVSGHFDLSKKTGAPIVYGPTANPCFDAIIAKDNQEFKVGACTVKLLHTPGHTLESSCFIISDENGKDRGLISGDTLFIGDVGRPDLAQDFADNLTQETLAAMLFKSLRTRIMPLADDIIVYPSHGAGSACGKNMSKETTDTLGNQKRVNYALRRDMTETEFIDELLGGLAAPPSYFPQNVKMNMQGSQSLDEVMSKSTTALSATEFRDLANNAENIVLDVRNEKDFAKAHIPNSIFIGIDGGFAPWVGAIIKNVAQPLLLVVPESREEETITRLSRVGFDNVLGFLDGGFAAWKNANFTTADMKSIDPSDFAKDYTNDTITIDARKTSEFEKDHVAEAINIPLDIVQENLERVPKKPFFLHCAGGYRSVIMGSILQKNDILNFKNIEGGMSAMRKTDLPLVVEVND